LQVSVYEVASQKKALEELAKLIEKSTVDPMVRNAALAITHDVDSRDDLGEVQAIFQAVKHGTEQVEGLSKGLKYMSDPRWADFFTSPSRILKQSAHHPSLAAGDCDDHAALICALLGSLGFVCGLRAWGRTKGEFTHVYAVVAMPKIGPEEFVGLDTTVEESEVGWEPPKGHVLTAIMDSK
jgi:hypothetical protein